MDNTLKPDDGSRRADRGRAALALVVILLACLPPLLIALGGRDSTHTMEAVAMVSSQETWLRWKGGEERAWLLPTNDSFNRVEKPPLLVWLNFAAWSDLSAGAPPSMLILRARLVTVGMGMLLLIGVFWIGCTIGGVRLGSIAAIIVGTSVFFQHQARTASYDMHFAAWATLAIAAALWAMHPFDAVRPASMRWARWARWGVAGVFLGAAWMTKGPLSLPVVLLPCLGAIGVMGAGWRRRLAGVAVAVAVAMAVSLPWYVFAWQVHDDSVRTWTQEFRQAWKEPQPLYYYVVILGLVAPWTVQLIAGLIYPLTSRAGPRRRRVLLSWVWFAIILVLFTVPGPKERRYILPILPACGLLAAQVWLLSARRDGDRADRLTMIRNGIHWGLLFIASLVLGPLLAMQEQLVAWEWVDRPPFASLAWPAAVGVSVVLILLSVLGMGWHRRDRVMAAGIACGAWMIIASTVVWWLYAGSATAAHPIRPEAEAVAQQVGEAPMRILRLPKTTFHTKLNEEFRLYFGRLIPHVSPDELQAFTQHVDGPVYVLARSKKNRDRIMTEAGFEAVMDVQVDEDEVQRLWKRSPDAG